MSDIDQELANYLHDSGNVSTTGAATRRSDVIPGAAWYAELPRPETRHADHTRRYGRLKEK